MKVLHWNRLLIDEESAEDQNTLWWRLPSLANLDLADFEARFGQKVRPKLERSDDGGSGSSAADVRASRRLSDAGGSGGTARREKLSVLEPKRSNAVGILASRLPALKALKTAILDLDEAVLDREQLEQIRAQLPSQEEVDEIARADGADVVWDRPEAFLKMLIAIPRVGPRLRCWAVARGFDEASEAIRVPADTLCKAIGELRDSRPLRALLARLLTLGNYLNGGTSRAQADGFAMTDLLAVCATRAGTGKHTLLSYTLAEEAKRHQPSAQQEGATSSPSPPSPPPTSMLALEASLPHLGNARKVSLSELQAQHATLASDVRQVARIAADEPEPGSHLKRDPFKATMAAFAERAEAGAAELGRVLKAAEEGFAELHAFFGMPSKATSDDELLGYFQDVVGAVKKAMPPPEKPKPKRPPPLLPTLSGDATAAESGPRRPAFAAELLLKRAGTVGVSAAEEGGGADEMQQLISAIRSGTPNLRKVRTSQGSPRPAAAAAASAAAAAAAATASAAAAGSGGAATVAAAAAAAAAAKAKGKAAQSCGACGADTQRPPAVGVTAADGTRRPPPSAAASPVTPKPPPQKLDASMFGNVRESAGDSSGPAATRMTAQQKAQAARLANIREQEGRRGAAARSAPATRSALPSRTTRTGEPPLPQQQQQQQLAAAEDAGRNGRASFNFSRFVGLKSKPSCSEVAGSAPSPKPSKAAAAPAEPVNATPINMTTRL